MNKIKKFFKKISVIIACGLFAFCTIPFYQSLDTLSASASSNELSIYDYEWANYFNFDAIDWEYVESEYDSASGRVFRSTDYNGNPAIMVEVKRSGIQSISFDLRESIVAQSMSCVPDCLPYTYYTFSCLVSEAITNTRFYLSFHLGDNLDRIYWANSLDSGEAKVFQPCDYLLESFTLYSYTSGFPVGCFMISEIMLVAGDSVCDSYTPYFYSLERLPDSPPVVSPNPDPDPVLPPSYGELYESYSDGFKAGYEEGLGYAKYSFFYNCRVDLDVLDVTGDVLHSTSSFAVAYVSNGITLSNVLPYLESIGFDLNRVAGVRLCLTFANPVSAELFHVRGIGNIEAFVNKFSLLTDTGVSYMGRFVEFEEPNIGYGIQAGVNSSNEEDILALKKANFLAIYDWTIYDINNLVGLTLLDYSAEYDVGYSTGYNDGVSAGRGNGFVDGYQQGLDKGYENGHRVGYDDGFVAGMSEDFEFLSLITAVVDAPVHYIMSLFSFEILGYNMQGVVIALLSACIIVALISFFTKGKND